MVTASGHPDRAHATLKALDKIMQEKRDGLRYAGDTVFSNGMLEMHALVKNLISDIASDYGIDRKED